MKLLSRSIEENSGEDSGFETPITQLETSSFGPILPLFYSERKKNYVFEFTKFQTFYPLVELMKVNYKHGDYCNRSRTIAFPPIDSS